MLLTVAMAITLDSIALPKIRARRSYWTSVQMSLHSWLNPAIERGDGLDHGVDASMPALRALIMEWTSPSMLSLSRSSVASHGRESLSLTVCRSISGFVFAHRRFLVGMAACQLQSIARAIGRRLESQSRLLLILQWIIRDATSSEAKARSIVDSLSFHRRVGVPGTVRSCRWKSLIIVSRG
jgi:hypothetical protein